MAKLLLFCEMMTDNAGLTLLWRFSLADLNDTVLHLAYFSF